MGKSLIAELKEVHGYDKLDSDYEMTHFATLGPTLPIESFLK